MDKGIPNNLFDTLVEALAERVAEKIRERPPFQWDPEGVRWITMRQAAEKTGIDYSTIVKATNAGELPCYAPLGRKRLDPIEVDEWVREYHSSTTSPTQPDPNIPTSFSQFLINTDKRQP